MRTIQRCDLAEKTLGIVPCGFTPPKQASRNRTINFKFHMEPLWNLTIFGFERILSRNVLFEGSMFRFQVSFPD